MLIQITNRCRMMCPHCMDASCPDGGLMDEATFGNALRLATENGCLHLTISGGEPTEHPEFLNFCKRASRAGMKFSICSNGMWLGDEKAEWRFERMAKLSGFAGAQVYTNPKWYRLHDETVAKFNAQKARWLALGVVLDLHDIRGMSDIGRGKTCEEAIEESKASPYRNICLAAHVTAAQVNSMRELFDMMLVQRRFCTPMVDWQGEFHASESWLCQSFGNVNRDSAETIFRNLKNGKPCCKCIPGKRYLASQEPKMVMARKLLGQFVQEKEGE